jgi:hypothetical protein
MPGTKTILGIFCSFAFGNIASTRMCPAFTTSAESRRGLIEAQRLLAHPNPSSVSVVLVFRRLLTRNLFDPNLRNSRYTGDRCLRSSRAANANWRVHRKKCCGNHQKALDISLFHYFLLQLRASVCSTIVLVLPIKPKRTCIDRRFECPRRERFPDDIERHRNPAVFTRRNTCAMLKLLFSGFLPVL